MRFLKFLLDNSNFSQNASIQKCAHTYHAVWNATPFSSSTLLPPNWTIRTTTVRSSLMRNNAGSRTDFWGKNRAIFSGELFSGELQLRTWSPKGSIHILQEQSVRLWAWYKKFESWEHANKLAETRISLKTKSKGSKKEFEDFEEKSEKNTGSKINDG